MDPARQQRSYADLRKLSIQLAAAEGLVGTHTYHLKKYKNCFVGKAAVTWLVAHGHARDRGAAVALGNRLVNEGLVRHVAGEHTFKDAFLFYRLESDAAAMRSKASWRKSCMTTPGTWGDPRPRLTTLSLSTWRTLTAPRPRWKRCRPQKTGSMAARTVGTPPPLTATR